MINQLTMLRHYATVTGMSTRT